MSIRNVTMAKYHVNKDGVAALCKASLQACPLGEAAHGDFGNPKDAQAFAETTVKEQFGGAFGGSRKTPIEPDLSHLPPLLASVAKEGSVAELLRNGDALLEADKAQLLSELQEISDTYGSGTAFRGNTGVPRELGLTDPDERAEYVRNARKTHPQNLARVEVLQRYVKDKPHKDIGSLIAYYKGENDEWDGQENGYRPERVLKYAPTLSEKAVERDAAMSKALSDPKTFQTKEFSKTSLARLNKLCSDVGLTVEDAVMVKASRDHDKNAKAFAEEHGLAMNEATELLFHGTSKANIMSLMRHGFEQNAGVFKSGAAAGEAFYFSHDPSVAGYFGRDKNADDDSSYVVLSKVVTGGPERTQDKDLGVSGDGRIRIGKLPKTLGRGADGKKNVSRRITIKGLRAGDYDEVTVHDSRQIVPVGILKVRGKMRPAI